MQGVKTIQGLAVLPGRARFGVVASRFNGPIVEHLLSGCLETLERHGVSGEDITLVKVPGAREIPLAGQRMAASGRFDAIIALGVIIRGSTPHFEYVAGPCSDGLAAIGSQYAIPVIFGVLTVETAAEAMERAGGKAGNRGADAALAAIEMVSLLGQIDSLSEMSKQMEKIRARRCAVQALYQWQMSGQEPHEIVRQFMHERDIGEIDEAYFSLLIREIPVSIEALERHLDGVLDRPITALDPVERGILAIGVHELLCHPDIPWRVVINEAVELAKMFGAEQSHKYINGVLDKVARSLRTLETRSVS